MAESCHNRSYYETAIRNEEFGPCNKCRKPKTDDDWCQSCCSDRFELDSKFNNKWTSGNDSIDGFVRRAQSKARNHWEVIEWIPYKRLINVKYLTKGGFSTINKAIWLDGYIICWNDIKNVWNRNRYKLEEEDYLDYRTLKEDEKFGFHVVLKSLNNINEDFLNEWENYLEFLYSAINNYANFVRVFGITQDPKTKVYMVVLEEMKRGSLRDNLLIKKYNPNDKYHNLYEIACSLSALSKTSMTHGDLHNGNLLLKDEFHIYISDFGQSRQFNQSINSKDIYGVIPYMAPEVLRGKPYTKASDIYSFGVIMWEFTSGVPAFHDIPHDFNLSLQICKGHRPEIIEGTEPDYVELMKRCWDNDPNKRPTAKELSEIFDVWSAKYLMEMDYDKRKSVPVPTIIENHPLSCYISRKIDHYAKLNEILDQGELSSIIVIDEGKDDEGKYNIESELEELKI
ncbi:kinase-like domain-containing protein [Rhizophagus irregularis DAOM 181602=DAOM 197198]|uniref:Kinase-like domain-containing protein n=1 Tax=Rhizophagus irregularis (strain DAOM 181602 / DAOM 197198 / MUCL 43194) TaxID=747089 RepID=A0A2P4QX14_RHIID|nr:kinase-like domain-containing protein [Rhizophagus irregularis DAOM 181602=DAOM 197198]POG82135.1 kinase-like domain-containing protein [Rhizophagus irregularis DAOM 181602=DAOM 197198]|eukprot:XP_025189001.1 kinase-like domain-containing protein [Rhizophagus irregularis DAOM 181602=DAOM 197198]